VVKLKYPEPSILLNLSSPWNWIYRADILAKDPHWYEKNINGTEPFKFVEHVKGSTGLARRIPITETRASRSRGVSRALHQRLRRAGRGHPRRAAHDPVPRVQRARLVQALGNKIAVQESPWDCRNFVSMHHEKKQFDDKRVRRALSLALDRYEGSKALSRITLVKDVGGIQVPGTPYATPPAELEKLAGYGRDINANRAEARRLLKEAGVPDGFSFVFKNRGIPHPYEPVGIWLGSREAK